METETEKKTVSEFIPVCPFNVRPHGEYKEPQDLKMVNRISDQVNVDKETLVVSPVIEQFDIQAEIQTYKDQCGLEYFQQLLLQGKAKPEDSHDDGSHGGDMTVLPKTIHDAHAQSSAISDIFSSLAKELGIKEGKAVTSDDLLELVAEKIAAKAAAPSVSDSAPKE